MTLATITITDLQANSASLEQRVIIGDHLDVATSLTEPKGRVEAGVLECADSKPLV